MDHSWKWSTKMKLEGEPRTTYEKTINGVRCGATVTGTQADPLYPPKTTYFVQGGPETFGSLAELFHHTKGKKC